MIQGHTGTALGIIADNSVLEGAVNSRPQTAFASRSMSRVLAWGIFQVLWGSKTPRNSAVFQ